MSQLRIEASEGFGTVHFHKGHTLVSLTSQNYDLSVAQLSLTPWGHLPAITMSFNKYMQNHNFAKSVFMLQYFMTMWLCFQQPLYFE